jgi:hypothetical protein
VGLPEVLQQRGVDLERVAVIVGRSQFGREVAAGAIDALAGHGARPIWVGELGHEDAPAAAAGARDHGAAAVVGCGRFDEDIALGAALRGTAAVVALVACGVAEIADHLGPAIDGWIGPSQWPADAPRPPFRLPRDAEYPAAQAAAAGIVAHAALAAAGSSDPGALWDAARSLRLQTHLGPFAVDALGQQIGASPSLVAWSYGACGGMRHTIWRPE